MKYKPAYILFITAVLLVGFLADDLAEKLKQALYAYSVEKPSSQLYLHCDKNIYMPGETIWFKAYLPSGSEVANEGLFVRIVDSRNQTVMEREFPMYDIRAHGDISLPDTIAEGNYLLYAFSDRMIGTDPQHTFVHHFTVVGNPAEKLVTSAYVNDTTTLVPGKKVDIICNVKRGGRLESNISGTYILRRQTEQVGAGKFTTNLLGQAVVSFIYPQGEDRGGVTLTAVFNHKNTRTELKLNLPPANSKVRIKSFAEGGSLVSGVPGRLLLQTSDISGTPLSARVTLLQNGEAVATTSTGNNGRGSLSFQPVRGGSYTYRLERGNSQISEPLDIPVNDSGWALRLNTKETPPSFMVYNRNLPEQALLVLRSANAVIWHKAVTVKSGDSLKVNVPGIDTIKQLLSLSVFPPDGRPHAERLFVTRPQENYRVEVKMDKATYRTRQKIKVTLKVTDVSGRPMAANVSVGVVTGKSFNAATYKTILSQTYGGLVLTAEDELYGAGGDAVNDILLGRQWHNSWAKVLQFKPAGYVQLIRNAAGMTGKVQSKRGKPVQEAKLLVFSSKGPNLVKVEANGNFFIPASELVSDGREKNYLMVTSDFNDKYTLTLKEYSAGHDLEVRRAGMVVLPDIYSTSTPPLPEVPVKEMNMLAEVKIRAKSELNDSLSYIKMLRNYPISGCLDYVCFNGVVNCPLHPFEKYGGDRPVFGMKYAGERNIYTVCRIRGKNVPKNSFVLNTVWLPRQILLPDYSTIDEQNKQYLSTLYWNPNINTNANGEATFEFNASDLKGAFRIIVQGIDVKTLLPLLGKNDLIVE